MSVAPVCRHVSDSARLNSAESANDLAPSRPTRQWSLPLQSKSSFLFDTSDAEAQTVMDDILIAARLAQRSKHDRYRTKLASQLETHPSLESSIAVQVQIFD